MTPRPSGWPWRKPRPSRPNSTPAPAPGPSAPKPPKPKRKAHFWLDFAVTLTNLCWPSMALWLLVVATQAGSLGYV